MIARLMAAVMAVCVLAPVTAARAQTPQGTPPPADPHAGHVMPAPPQPPDPHAGHVMPAPARERVVLPPFIPPVTDEMRAAAFPDVHGHAAHDRRINGFVLFDQLEWQSAKGTGGVSWSNTGWVGGDVNRLWFRTEGEGVDGGLNDAQAHVLYGRPVARWWDVVAGVRQDFRPGTQTWLAFGVQGLAPGFFEVHATAYLADDAQTAAHVEVGYDLRITNRLVLQPRAEVSVYSKSNASLGVGSGLSTGEAGLRVRYHLTREFAPYLGVSWARAFGDTADMADDEIVPNGAPRLVAGVRVWF